MSNTYRTESRLSKPDFKSTLGPIVQEIFRFKVGVSVIKSPENPFLGGYISELERATLLKFDTLIEWSLSFPNLVSNLL